MLRIALLHLSPKVGDLRHNEQLVQNGARLAAELGAEWVVTPELCISGYDFVPYLGADWIGRQPDTGVESFCDLARQLRITLFLGHAERDADTQLLYNTVFVIGPGGDIIGKHHKRRPIPGIEGWSSPDEEIAVVTIPSPPLKVGVLICADAYSPHVARRLQEQGANVLVSSAAWPTKPHGPETSWEDRARETGLPLFVCNRTGVDHELNFCDAESVVAMSGRRVLSFQSLESTVILIDWDLAKHIPVLYEVYRVPESDVPVKVSGASRVP